jgi:hypothetical protein
MNKSRCIPWFTPLVGALVALTSFQASAQTPAAPAITTQPASLTVATGATAAFTVVATGTAPLSYQWFKNDTAISSATTAALTLNAVSATDAANYTVKITNTVGTVTSNIAALTVTPPPITAPVITTQPTSLTVAAGAAATFSVTATGTGTLNYSWFKEGRLVASGNSASFTIASTSAADAGSYRVVVTGSGGATVSNSVTLTVTGATTPPVVGTAPTITTQPTSLLVAAGAKATFTVVATGTPAPNYVWMKNDHAIDGSNSATFTISAATVDDAAVYTVRVSNSAGSVTSAPASLSVNVVAGTIAAAPANVTAAAGTDAKLVVNATGTGLTYQWKRNGRAIAGATSATLTLTGVGTLSAGDYNVTISNSSGPAAAAALALTVTTDARLINIATRGHVGSGDEVLISGFVTRGDATKKILIRAVGPTLGTAFNVTGALANPTLTLYSASKGNVVVDTNSGWGGSTALTTAFTQVGAFPLAPTSADAALLETLASGAYSATVTAPGTTSGVALVEVYDADTGTPTAEVVNISTRALVGAEAADTLIAGFAIAGTTSDTVIIRGVGASLGTLFGMRQALGASHVAVFDSKGNQVAANTVWAAGRDDRDDDEADTMNDLDEASDRVGAWRLPHGSTDSALLLTLAPGVYTAHVTGVGGKSGIGLVEIYEVH